MQWNRLETLGEEKNFQWSYDGEKIKIFKEIKSGEITVEYSNEEMDRIIDFINKAGQVTLSNGLEKFKNVFLEEYKNDEYYTKGIGMFVYKNIEQNSTKAQSVSQLVAILVNKKILDYNKKKTGMIFWIENKDWKNRIEDTINDSRLEKVYYEIENKFERIPFKYRGISITKELISTAIQVLSNVKNNELPQNCRNLVKEKTPDGLDRRIKEKLSTDLRTANIISDVLQEVGVVEVFNRRNPRTGKFKKWTKLIKGASTMKTYNKLVRDRIPEVIKNAGKEFDIRIAKGQEKSKLLEEKLKEEVNEYLEEKNLEELADVLEVLIGLANDLGYSEDDLMKKREEKKADRGGFSCGIVLEKVY